jgi:thiamine biosynthesis lipoprotein
MKRTELIMGMPITVTIVGKDISDESFKIVFDYFRIVDARYSTYKTTSEISRINFGLPEDQWSDEMKEILALCEQTKQQTNGYFDITHNDQRDPSGLVKGWAIWNAAKLLQKRGIQDFSIDAGGDIQVSGRSLSGDEWRLGIRNPFNHGEIIKVVSVRDQGVATSGTYIRGQHVYNPKQANKQLTNIISLTVIGPNIYQADRFATAAFAMEYQGIEFIEKMKGFEGYMIDNKGIATMTSGFKGYIR